MQAQADVHIRTHRVGDVGWMLERHAVLYAEEFGYSPVFERYVAMTIPPFLQEFDAARDRLWVAEDPGGRRLGCIALHHVDDPEHEGWAKLRWFLLEPEARGLGLGRRLMQDALAFARQAGYKGVYLLTVNDLHDARRLYEKAGFRLKRHDSEPCPWAPWGHEQEWALAFGA